ncbi:MAG: glycoside hydrolase family 57 protein [Bacteroidales bacterium]|nr:glycoside hydrolase family 57 protein [Bacteroidales bacterium]MDD2264193.1 glycoside hydrolase family 57 protein [Bacteroidales bacterium]MDD2831335.1 glycoside hydrolase family 57 protein [Bacteroidales bacterium]MDD3208330.1 glycoside hydrolase family 57 protein [Bacteroidales bacterium]MDD3696987.1 glycoside hydrolase family 57 protein [Bacteroidales bacterium]
MKKTLCLYFQVHQPYRLRQYRFFDIGKNHDYFDDFANKTIMARVATRCYIPANRLMLELINKYDGAFKITYSISGIALEQMEQFAPQALESFQELAKTGHVEFLSETYSHSLSSLISPRKFRDQIKVHVNAVEKHFGQKPKAFRNTELIYSDTIGEMVAGMGFATMLTEGARHILGWKSPNYIYVNALNPKLKLLLRNFRLSDDIAFRFSNKSWGDWPLTAEKYAGWIAGALEKDDIVNIFMDYESFGEHQPASSGIFDFLKAMPGMILNHTNLEIMTPSQAAAKHQPIAPLNVPYAISWADEERDISAWLGNELQQEAFNNLYKIEDLVRDSNDPDLQRDFRRLQASDHFYYMCTKFFSDGDVHKYFNPYDTPYEAFINYMNVLSDITLRASKK